jgi:inner membrane protein
MTRDILRNSIGLRIAIILGLTLVLCIPALLIQYIIYEREHRRNDVLTEITSKWGEDQLIKGPVLSLPVYYEDRKTDGSVKNYTRYLYVLPDKFNISGTIIPQTRYRGIYQITLYGSDLNFSGNFKLPSLNELNIRNGIIQYRDAVLEFGLSDMKGLTDGVNLQWNNQAFPADAGIKNCTTLAKGFHIKAPLTEELNNYTFSCNIKLNGSETLSFSPVGEETRASISSRWAHPSFTGDFLPVIRHIEQDRFQAEWKVLNLNRNFPQYTFGAPPEFDNSSFGVRLYYPVDQYQKSMRTVKYAILFIGLTFLSYFLIEILNRQVLHPVQYLLIGSALVLFYLLLLSLSEHMNFIFAYLASSLSMIALITFYTRAIFKSTRFSLIISGVLALLYGFLYINLQLQDYALLFGSLGLFGILALVMYLTRHIDWFTGLQSRNELQT